MSSELVSKCCCIADNIKAHDFHACGRVAGRFEAVPLHPATRGNWHQCWMRRRTSIPTPRSAGQSAMHATQYWRQPYRTEVHVLIDHKPGLSNNQGIPKRSSTLLYKLRNAWQLAQHTGVCCAAGGAAVCWGTGVMNPPSGMPSLLAPWRSLSTCG